MQTQTVGVVNYKGGTSKTTTAYYLAHAWAEQGRSVLLVDADPQGSSLRWSELAPGPVPVIGLAVRDVHRRLPGIAGGRYEVVVIDTPPLEERAGIVQSVLRAVTHLVVPIAPTMIEVDRLPPVWDVLADVGSLRDAPLHDCVLLTRTIANASSTAAIRHLVETRGNRVLRAQIPRLERYAQAFGEPVPPGDELYAAVAAEVLP